MKKEELNKIQKVMLDFASKAGVEFVEDDENIYLKIDQFDNDNIPFNKGYSNVVFDDNKMLLSQNAYSIDKYKNSHYNFNECLQKNVVINLDEKENLITVAQNERRSFNYVTVGDDPMTDYAIYNLASYQKVTEFRANDNCLEVDSADVTQVVKEDTMGGGDWIIVNFNNIKDFDNNSNAMKFLPLRSLNTIRTNKENYFIPKDYNIVDCSKFIENSKIKK